jgi:Ca-activated chloride channel homolog
MKSGSGRKRIMQKRNGNKSRTVILAITLLIIASMCLITGCSRKPRNHWWQCWKKGENPTECIYPCSASTILPAPPVRIPLEACESDGDMDIIVSDNSSINSEDYDRIYENTFLNTKDNPLSTFSIDVDTASYSNIRRMINNGTLPPADAVRIEEMINYFSYDYPLPTGEHPYSVTADLNPCPWNERNFLFRIGLKGAVIEKENRPPSNLVFLIDVSGSMNYANRLSLVKKSLKLLIKNLIEDDYVAMVVYAGSSGLVLPSTSAGNKNAVLEAITRLQSGGSTNAGEGIMLAYETAAKNFITDGVNRVILCTDGDFNVGITDRKELTDLIEKEAKTGIFLSILGFGMGNLKDATMEELSNKGNGNYAYIDTEKEARKVLVEEMSGTLHTIAKDVKIQVEFNPVEVKSYRLIGYENRALMARDFNDDKKDAGEMGAGHTVTALYEIEVQFNENRPTVEDKDSLKYQEPRSIKDEAFAGEIATVKLRYKKPDEDKSNLMIVEVKSKDINLSITSPDLNFAAAVASFGMILRNSDYKGNSSMEKVIELAEKGLSNDKHGYRKEFIELIEKYRDLKKDTPSGEKE